MSQEIQAPPSEAQHPDNLSVRERRGRLSAAETRRLQMALTASETLRCSHQLGCDFDALQTQRAGDAALIERLVARTRARYEVATPPRVRSLGHRALPWVGVMSLLLVSAAAGATLWPYARALVAPSPSLAPGAASSTVVDQVPRVALRRPVVDAAAESVVGVGAGASLEQRSGVAVPAATLDVVAAPRPNPMRESVALDTGMPLYVETDVASTMRLELTQSAGKKSAAELFSEANAARRRGDIEPARALYRELRDAYPAAKETALSYALLARVALQRGEVADALQQFDRYLLVAPGGALAEEALEGKASAYRQLGLKAQEVIAWRELLNRYPNSVYAKLARERLGELL